MAWIGSQKWLFLSNDFKGDEITCGYALCRHPPLARLTPDRKSFLTLKMKWWVWLPNSFTGNCYKKVWQSSYSCGLNILPGSGERTVKLLKVPLNSVFWYNSQLPTNSTPPLCLCPGCPWARLPHQPWALLLLVLPSKCPVCRVFNLDLDDSMRSRGIWIDSSSPRATFFSPLQNHLQNKGTKFKQIINKNTTSPKEILSS